MDDATATLAVAIGQRVRQHRLARGWTLDELAQAASVSRRAVVSVEQGEANPSVGTLLRLSDALGVGLPSLVESAERTPMRVVRSGEGARLWTGDAGGAGILVAGTEPPDVVELWDWTLQSGERHSAEAHLSGTRELIHVLSGRVTLEVGADSVVLSAGDAASFRGDLRHSYSSGSRKARFALTVFEPGVGAGSAHDGAPRG
jgi:transcriptional regulator with XRE-family HTH domain